MNGSISTQHFGKRFNSTLAEPRIGFFVQINPPKSADDNGNVNLHIHIEKVQITELDQSQDMFSVSGKYREQIDKYARNIVRNLTPPATYTINTYRRQ